MGCIAPMGWGVPGLLFQFAQRGGLGFLTLANRPGGELDHMGLEVVPVLADEDEPPIGGDGDDHDAGRGVDVVPVVWRKPAEEPACTAASPPRTC
jgi:hypothetical protein